MLRVARRRGNQPDRPCFVVAAPAMGLLIQFLLRLTFGLAVGMAITSPKLVTSGYFRNHLYVTLGLASLAAMLSLSAAPEVLAYAIVAAIASYLGAVYWLFERPAPGKLMLVIVAVAAWAGASNQDRILIRSLENESLDASFANAAADDKVASQSSNAARQGADSAPRRQGFLEEASIVSSGLLLGITMAAMLLGHWYLNTPTMDLVPLRRLILAMGVAVGLQTILSSLGLWSVLAMSQQVSLQWMLFVALRWTFGLVGVVAMTGMAWETLKIPNTQSATGILYVAVIGTFVGETMALLLSSESPFPL